MFCLKVSIFPHKFGHVPVGCQRSICLKMLELDASLSIFNWKGDKWCMRSTYGGIIVLVDVSYVELISSKLKDLEIRVIIFLIHAQNVHDGLVFSEQKLPVWRFIGSMFRWCRSGNVDRHLCWSLIHCLLLLDELIMFCLLLIIHYFVPFY